MAGILETGLPACRPLHAVRRGEQTIEAEVVFDTQERYAVSGAQAVREGLPRVGCQGLSLHWCLTDWVSSLGRAILAIITSKTTAAVDIVEEGTTIFLRPGGRCIGGR